MKASLRTVGSWETGEARPTEYFAAQLDRVFGDSDPTAAREDVRELDDWHLWRLKRETDAEIERRYFARRTQPTTHRARPDGTHGSVPDDLRPYPDSAHAEPPNQAHSGV